jgi:hypothetical protein
MKKSEFFILDSDVLMEATCQSTRGAQGATSRQMGGDVEVNRVGRIHSVRCCRFCSPDAARAPGLGTGQFGGEAAA